MSLLPLTETFTVPSSCFAVDQSVFTLSPYGNDHFRSWTADDGSKPSLLYQDIHSTCYPPRSEVSSEPAFFYSPAAMPLGFVSQLGSTTDQTTMVTACPNFWTMQTTTTDGGWICANNRVAIKTLVNRNSTVTVTNLPAWIQPLTIVWIATESSSVATGLAAVSATPASTPSIASTTVGYSSKMPIMTITPAGNLSTSPQKASMTMEMSNMMGSMTSATMECSTMANSTSHKTSTFLGLSPGATAGVGIGASSGLTLIVIAAIWFWRIRRRRAVKPYSFEGKPYERHTEQQSTRKRNIPWDPKENNDARPMYEARGAFIFTEVDHRNVKTNMGDQNSSSEMSHGNVRMELGHRSFIAELAGD